MTRLYSLAVINDVEPKYSWKLAGKYNQTGYEIIVNDELGNVVWDSGKVDSEERHKIVGPKLPAEANISWKVRVFLEDGSQVEATGPSFITRITNWDAKWIEPNRTRKPLIDKKKAWEVRKFEQAPIERLDSAIYIRKEFEVDKLPAKALLYTSARGVYTAYLNGQRISSLFAPGYTSYNERIDYQVVDVKKLLRQGKNTLAFILTDGWYTGKIEYIGVGQQYGTENSLISELKLYNDDKVSQVISSSKEFKWTDKGALRYSDLYVGEYYRQADELLGWMDSGYDDSDWQSISEKDYAKDVLQLQVIPEITAVRKIRPIIRRTPKGELVLDAGETIVGYTAFNNINLAKGNIVSLEHSETLDKDGNFLQNILGQNKEQKDYYEASENGLHSFSPVGTFHGFRYVKVEGTLDCDPSHYEIYVIATPMNQAGNLDMSDERLNRLQANIIRSQEGNMISIPTDCPQRERTGWTGDMQVYAPTACYEKDVEVFLEDWLDDMQREQYADGQIPQVVPCPPSHDYMKPEGEDAVDTAGWSDAAVIVPWRLYEFYGDKALLNKYYPMMKRYMDSIKVRMAKLPTNFDELSVEEQKYQPYLWNTDFQYGDWLMPSHGQESSKVTGNEVATLMVVLTTDLMSKITRVLGMEDESRAYQEWNQKIKEAYQYAYMTANGLMTSDYQGIYVLGLVTETVPEKWRAANIKRLKELIEANDNKLDTGFLSVAYLLPVLNSNGEQELANKLLFQDQSPSWLYEVKMGATTMWEAWNCYAEDGTPSRDSMNHFAFGCIGEYLFRTVLGIDKLVPGFKEVLIKPDFSVGLQRVTGSYDSIWGKIEVAWKIIGKQAKLRVILPPNVKARVEIGNKLITDVEHELETEVTLG